MARFTPRTTEREMRSAWWDIKERVLGRVGRAVDAAARDFAREAAQLEIRTAVGEKPPPNVSWSSRLKLLRLTKIASW